MTIFERETKCDRGTVLLWKDERGRKKLARPFSLNWILLTWWIERLHVEWIHRCPVLFHLRTTISIGQQGWNSATYKIIVYGYRLIKFPHSPFTFPFFSRVAVWFMGWWSPPGTWGWNHLHQPTSPHETNLMACEKDYGATWY